MDIRDIFERFFDGYARENLYTSLPARIVSVKNYSRTQTIDVTPSIARLKTSGQSVSNDDIIIYEVPVVSPAGGGALMSFPLKEGDLVWLNFSMRNLEDWQNSDGNADVIPSDSRHYNMSDAIAFPCIYTSTTNLNPSANNVELKFKDNHIVLTPDMVITITNGNSTINMDSSGEVLINNNSGSIKLESSGEITLTPASKVIVNGDLEATGDVKAGAISLKTHTHIGSPTAPSGAISNTGLPQ